MGPTWPTSSRREDDEDDDDEDKGSWKNSGNLTDNTKQPVKMCRGSVPMMLDTIGGPPPSEASDQSETSRSPWEPGHVTANHKVSDVK